MRPGRDVHRQGQSRRQETIRGLSSACMMSQDERNLSCAEAWAAIRLRQATAAADRTCQRQGFDR